MRGLPSDRPALLLSFDAYTVAANERVTETFGWRLEELAILPYWEVVHPEDQDAAVAGVDALLCRRAESYSETARVLCRDGAYRRGRWRGRLVAGCSLVELVEEEAGADNVVGDRRAVATWRWDRKGGLRCSPELPVMFELPERDTLDVTQALEKLREIDRVHLTRALWERPELGETHAVTVAIECSNGPRWIRVVGRPEPDPAGKARVSGVAYVVTDLPFVVPPAR